MVHLTYTVYDQDIGSFPFWGGAKKVWESIEIHPREEDILQIVESLYDREDCLSETQVNDIMCFTVPSVVEEFLGIKL